MPSNAEAVAAVRLNEQGQCPVCDRTPVTHAGETWCIYCTREFNPTTGEQVEGLCWRRVGPSTFVCGLVDPYPKNSQRN